MQALRGRSELGVAVLLAAVGVVVAVDASGLEAGTAQVGPIGPKVVPLLVSGLLLVCAALLAVDILRGGRGELEGGEDVDLSHGSDWRTVLLLVGAFVANIALIDRAGWVISGTILFWGSVYALGSRHYVRDAIVAVVLSVTTFYAFYVGLGIALPAGVLQGVL
jgi:putative tricarboxylic transport membrane protein